MENRENTGKYYVSTVFSASTGDFSFFGLNSKLMPANASNLEVSKVCHLEKELTVSQTTNFRFFQTERVCR